MKAADRSTKQIPTYPELLKALRGGPRPMREVWMEIAPGIAYPTFRSRVDRQMLAGRVNRFIAFRTSFIETADGGDDFAGR